MGKSTVWYGGVLLKALGCILRLRVKHGQWLQFMGSCAR